MNYQAIYNRLCEKGKQERQPNKRYGAWERHHIIPKSLGETNYKHNITTLQQKEHAIAHLLLYKIHGRKQDYKAYYMIKGRKGSPWTNKEYRERMTKQVIKNLSYVDRVKARKATRKAGLYMYKHKIGIHAPEMREVSIRASQDWVKNNPDLARKRALAGHKNRTKEDHIRMSKNKSKHIIIGPDGTFYTSVAEASYITGESRQNIDNWSRRNNYNWSRIPNTAKE